MRHLQPQPEPKLAQDRFEYGGMSFVGLDLDDERWNQVFEIGVHELKPADEPTLTTSIIGVLAIANDFTEDERQEMLTNAGWG